MTELSPAAQAVLDELINTGVNSRQWADGKAPQIKLAAALRAAADQVVPPGQEHWLAEWTIRRKLRALATELEGAN